MESIKQTIIGIMKSNPKFYQMPKKDIIEWAACKEGCSQKEASKAFSELKKEGKAYSVIGLSGWVGIYIKGETET